MLCSLSFRLLLQDLHDWHVEKCSAHPCFAPVAAGSRNTVNKTNPNISTVTLAEEGQEDPCIAAMLQDTEESKKVSRNNGQKYYAVFRRRSEEEICACQPGWISSFSAPAADGDAVTETAENA